jgi:undecaprenyl pyrophosphate phosphatase UppP
MLLADGDGAETAASVGAAALPEILIGAVAAMIVGYFAARFMLSAVRKISLKWFSVYVAALGLLILLDQFVFGLVFDKLI